MLSEGLNRVILSKCDRCVTYQIQSAGFSVEVGPLSFLKVEMLGKGDVGKVYLVREKKTDKLFAMKGTWSLLPVCPVWRLSAFQY